MRTEDLIKALDADARRKALPLGPVWLVAVPVSVLAAAAVFFATIGPRPDIAAVMHTVRFPAKFLYTLALAIGALATVRTMAIPGARIGKAARWLAVAPALVLVAVALEMLAVPPSDWLARLVGSNMLVCLTCIPTIGIGPLAVFLVALRHGAPTRPILAGAAAGLLAGGLAATFYAAHCTDDSPLFVATWYTLAIGALAGFGALGGRYLLRW